MLVEHILFPAIEAQSMTSTQSHVLSSDEQLGEYQGAEVATLMCGAADLADSGTSLFAPYGNILISGSSPCLGLIEHPKSVLTPTAKRIHICEIGPRWDTIGA
jgi:hypothetical protein